MAKKKLGNGPSVARQKFSVGSAAQTVLDLLDNLRSRELPMPERRAGSDANQPCDLSDPQPRVTAEQEVASNTHAGIIAVALLEKLKRCLQNGYLLIV